MRPFAIVLLLLSACFGLAGPAMAQWQEYRPAGAGYRLEFPGKPRETQGGAQTRAGVMQVSVAEVESAAAGTFVAGYTVFRQEAMYDDPQHTLVSARDGAVRNVNGKLRSEQRLTVSGAPALRFTVEIPKNNQLCFGLLVLSGTRLYQALVAVPASRERSAEAERFLRSFALVR